MLYPSCRAGKEADAVNKSLMEEYCGLTGHRTGWFEKESWQTPAERKSEREKEGERQAGGHINRLTIRQGWRRQINLSTCTVWVMTQF